MTKIPKPKCGQVIDLASWDASGLLADISWLVDHRWWLILWLLLATALAVVILFIRHVSSRRDSSPLFFVLALVVHLFLAAGSFFIYFGDAIVQHVKEEFEEIKISPNLADSDQSHRRQHSSYEKVADLPSVATERVHDVTRQTTPPDMDAAATESAIRALPVTVSSGVAMESKPERFQVEEPRTKPPFLNRRRPEPRFEGTENRIAPQRLQSAQTAAAPPVLAGEPLTIAAKRNPSNIAPAPLPKPTLEATTPVAPRPPNEIKADRSAESRPLPTTSRIRLSRSLPKSPQSTNERIVIGPIHSIEAGGLDMPPSEAVVEVQRKFSKIAEPALHGDTSNTVSNAARSRDTSLARQSVQPTSPDFVPSASKSSDVSNPPRLTRATQMLRNTEQAEVEIATTTNRPSSSNAKPDASDFHSSERVDILHRQEFFIGRVNVPKVVPDRANATTPQIASTVDELRREMFDPSHPPTRGHSAAVARRSPRNHAVHAVEMIPLVAADVDAGGQKSAVRSGRPSLEQIEIERSQADALLAALPAQPRLPVGRRRRHHATDRDRVGAITADIGLRSGTHSTKVARQRTRDPAMMYAEDNIGLRAMLKLRGVDDTVKREMITAFGGSAETLDAIRLGLDWLAEKQHPDGHWSLQNFYGSPIGGQHPGHQNQGQGAAKSDTAATGLALLPFLGDGHTHRTGQYQQTVVKGLNWLANRQKGDGDLFLAGTHTARMYSHAIGTMALCEAYGMSKDPHWREPAQKAVDFIVSAQHSAGGWRYSPREPGDTSVMGWQIMALKSAQMAELAVPDGTIKKAKHWLNRVAGTGGRTGQFGYQTSDPSVAMTAEALLCLEYLGVKSSDSRVRSAATFLLNSLPAKGKESSYYWYYGTQAMYHLQGEFWREWNDALHPIVVSTQHRRGEFAGTWDPRDQWERQGGRIYATSLRLLMLEIYYRHLPLYQALAQ